MIAALIASRCSVSLSCHPDRLEPKPAAHRSFHPRQSRRIKRSDSPHEFNRRSRPNSLRIKSPCIESRSVVENLKASLPLCGRPWNISNKRPLILQISDAEDNDRANFPRNPKINQPNLATIYFGPCH